MKQSVRIMRKEKSNWTQGNRSNHRVEKSTMRWIRQYLRIDMFFRWFPITKIRHVNTKSKQTAQGGSAKFKIKSNFSAHMM